MIHGYYKLKEPGVLATRNSGYVRCTTESVKTLMRASMQDHIMGAANLEGARQVRATIYSLANNYKSDN